jgi:hypothetical protein
LQSLQPLHRKRHLSLEQQHHYPIKPLHQRGSKSDADNCRAVAVSSALGKLLSTILLNRIIELKNENKPDPINQIGFSKAAQTCDQIFTLNTITSKYKKSTMYAVRAYSSTSGWLLI